MHLLRVRAREASPARDDPNVRSPARRRDGRKRRFFSPGLHPPGASSWTRSEPEKELLMEAETGLRPRPPTRTTNPSLTASTTSPPPSAGRTRLTQRHRGTERSFGCPLRASVSLREMLLSGLA